jgi:hypothetical protein
MSIKFVENANFTVIHARLQREQNCRSSFFIISLRSFLNSLKLGNQFVQHIIMQLRNKEQIRNRTELLSVAVQGAKIVEIKVK